MSKKLLSLVLAVAMVMSVFCVAFSTTAAAASTKLTYYFLAPEEWVSACDEMFTHYWDAEGPQWPGAPMTKAPEIGNNVYKVEVPILNKTIIFDNKKDGVEGTAQTINLDITEATTGLKNVNNMIFVVTGANSEGQATGEWLSLDAESEKYYRNSSAYTLTDDAEQTAFPKYDDSFETGVETDPNADVIEGVEGKTISFNFEASGDFENYDRMCFYIWDDNNGGHAYKDGTWRTTNNWGGKKTISVTAEEGNPNLYKSFDVTIPDGHEVYVIIHAFDSNPQLQTCNIILTADADGDTLYITGDMLENPVDSTQATIEAKFKNTEKCGPAKVVTSTCKVVGTVLQGDAATKLAEGIKNYYTNDKDWTRENVKAAEEALGVTDEDVQKVLDTLMAEDKEGLAAASELLKDAPAPVETGDTPAETDTDKKDDNTDIDKTETGDTPAPVETGDTPAETDTDKKDDNTDTDKTETGDTPAPVETGDTPAPVETGDTPAPVETGDTPAPVETGDTPTPVETGDTPAPVETGDTPDTDTDKKDNTDTDKKDDNTDTDKKDNTDTDKKDNTDTDKKDNTDKDKKDDKGPKKFGDFNGDGEITADDALLILRASMGLEGELDAVFTVAIDVNKDGSITSDDALVVLRFSVKLIETVNFVGELIGA